jgi:hypothetical protein
MEINLLVAAIAALAGAIASIIVRRLEIRAQSEKESKVEIEKKVARLPDYFEETLPNAARSLRRAMNSRSVRPLKGIYSGDISIDSYLDAYLDPILDFISHLPDDEVDSEATYYAYERQIKQALKRIAEVRADPDKLFEQFAEQGPRRLGPFVMRDVAVAVSTFVLVHVLYVVFIVFSALNLVTVLTKVVSIIQLVSRLFQ